MRNAEVLPLFARLSQAEQDRIFDGHSGAAHRAGHQRGRNLADGARHPLRDRRRHRRASSATASAARWSSCRSSRSAQAAANQRAGRCGRVANGICIRLYDEKDFAGAAALHRSGNPALVAGRRDPADEVAAAGRGGGLSVPRRAIAPGDRRRLPVAQRTGRGGRCQRPHALGQELARLPLDPRVARMIVEGRERGALDEVLVIASALSVQDVRDRPMEMQAQADQQHAKFDDEKSEFSGYLRLWNWLDDARGGAEGEAFAPGRLPQAADLEATAPGVAALPRRVARALLRALLAARVSHARQRLRAHGRHDPEGLRLVTTADRVAGARRRASRGRRVRDPVIPDQPHAPCARRSSGSPFSTADRQARYVPIGHEGEDASGRSALASAAAPVAARRALRALGLLTAAARRRSDRQASATTSSSTSLCWRGHGIALRGPDVRLDAGELPAGRQPVQAHPLEEAALEHLGYKALTRRGRLRDAARRRLPLRRICSPDALLNFAGERADLARQLSDQLAPLLVDASSWSPSIASSRCR